MGLVAIKTSAGTGYCECVCGCYELVSLRDEETGKSYCPRCAEEHLTRNQGLGLNRPAPSAALPSSARGQLPSTPLGINGTSGTGPAVAGASTETATSPPVPPAADPPGRLR